MLTILSKLIILRNVAGVNIGGHCEPGCAHRFLIGVPPMPQKP
jgi:hypothetical protein